MSDEQGFYSDICRENNRLRNEAKALQTRLAEYEKRGDGPCFICGKSTDSVAGNPGLWPVYPGDPRKPGTLTTYHFGCVMERLDKAAEYDKALQRDNGPEFAEWLKELAASLDKYSLRCGNAMISADRLKEAATQLRYMAEAWTLKANFVPYNLKIREWWWLLRDYSHLCDDVKADMETFMCEHQIPLEKPINQPTKGLTTR